MSTPIPETSLGHVAESIDPDATCAVCETSLDVAHIQRIEGALVDHCRECCPLPPCSEAGYGR